MGSILFKQPQPQQPQQKEREWGLARPLEELVAMWPAQILQMTMEQQSELADSVCREFAQDRVFCEEQLIVMRADFPAMPPTNATGLANLAHLALHAHPDFRDEYDTIYRAYLVLLKRTHNVPDISV